MPYIQYNIYKKYIQYNIMLIIQYNKYNTIHTLQCIQYNAYNTIQCIQYIHITQYNNILQYMQYIQYKYRHCRITLAPAQDQSCAGYRRKKRELPMTVSVGGWQYRVPSLYNTARPTQSSHYSKT